MHKQQIIRNARNDISGSYLSTGGNTIYFIIYFMDSDQKYNNWTFIKKNHFHANLHDKWPLFCKKLIIIHA